MIYALHKAWIGPCEFVSIPVKLFFYMHLFNYNLFIIISLFVQKGIAQDQIGNTYIKRKKYVKRGQEAIRLIRRTSTFYEIKNR